MYVVIKCPPWTQWIGVIRAIWNILALLLEIGEMCFNSQKKGFIGPAKFLFSKWTVSSTSRESVNVHILTKPNER